MTLTMSLICIVLVCSCKNQDFDWETAHNENQESLFQNLFSSIFGSVDPNQNWDFTKGTKLSATRAGEDYSPTVPTDWYYVEKSTLDWMNDQLKEGKNNTDLGSSFVMILPEAGFKITPIYQGQAGLIWKLFMVVDGDAENPIEVWSKSQDIEYQDGNGCEVCHGEGYTACSNCHGYGKEECETCHGDKVTHSTQLVDCETCNGTGQTTINCTTCNHWWHAGELQCTKCNGSGYTSWYPSMVTCDKCNGTGWMTCTTCNGTTVISSTCATCNGAKKVEKDVQITCTTCNGTGLSDEDCHVCGGDGGKNTCSVCGGSGASSSGTWKNVSERNSQEYLKCTIDATAVRAKSRVWGNEEETPLPAFKEVYFYLQIVGGNYEGNGNSYPGYAEYNRKQSSINNQMRLLTCPRPSNVPESHEVAIIGCEDANLSNSDWDYNDVVFLIEGLPKIPSEVIIEEDEYSVEEKVEKRYMVEDMGYLDHSSTDESLCLTDIDFNDIVVDFTRTCTAKHKLTIENGVVISDVVTRTDPVTSAKIRALGGTWDFALYVGNNKVFQKSDDLSQAKYAYAGKNHPVTLNEEYPFFKKYNASSFNAGTIYNTGYGSDQRGDGGIYDTSNYLASFDVDGWDPENNNIVFVLVDEDLVNWNLADTYGSSTADGKNVYKVSFPDTGACPKIVAFDVTKDWQRERVHVTKDWFK